jgi:AmmeMemoRadiSam system protein B
MIVPHAGYRYSGRIAASAFKHVQGLAPNVVAVLSPLHHPHPSPLYTSGHKAYATPLGEIPIDHDLVAALREHLSQTAHLDLDEILVDEEHSLEIELPFLQYALRSQFCLLPVMLRDQSAATAQALGRTLGLLLRDRAALLVASSDLSHFQTESVARRLDEYVLQRIEAFDPLGVLSAEELGRGSACGRGAIATALWAAKALGADDVSVLQYGHSGEVTGDRRHVVGYAAALITCQPRQG